MARKEKASLSSGEGSEANTGTLSPQESTNEVALLTPDEIGQWEQTGPEVRTGTACKCGAHTSARWEDGGREWFTGHVLENHVDEKKQLAQLARITVFVAPDQETFTLEEVNELLARQREAIAARISGQ